MIVVLNSSGGVLFVISVRKQTQLKRILERSIARKVITFVTMEATKFQKKTVWISLER